MTYRILCLARHNQHIHYAPLAGFEDFELIETADWRAETVQQIMPDVLVTLTDEWYEAQHSIAAARDLGIPSLYMMDGILDWRTVWENPVWGSGGGVAINQPALTDKIACLGWQTARMLASWGNTGRCEVIGVPRFDHYLTNPIPPAEPNTPRRLLIMTANTPGFTAQQMAQIEHSLADIRDYLAGQNIWEPIWRVTSSLDQKLHLQDNFSDLKSKPLREVLTTAHAVLTTPSTVMLEAMLARRPVALLDYTNSPAYIPAAWTITAAAHIAPVLDALAHPDQPRLLFQDTSLHNALACDSPAAPRLAALIRAMAETRQQKQPLPTRIIPLPEQSPPSPLFDLQALYPDHPVFSQPERLHLQMQLNQARSEIRDLKRKHERLKLYGLRPLLMQLIRRWTP